MRKINLLLNHNEIKPAEKTTTKMDCMWNNSWGKNICCHFCKTKCGNRCIDELETCKYKIKDKSELSARPTIINPQKKKQRGRPKKCV